MNKNKYWFTLLEIIIAVPIMLIISFIMFSFFTNFLDTFYIQKGKLDFQQSFILDNFYINKKINNSYKILNLYSSWNYNRKNSILTIINEKPDYHYSTIYLWNDNGKILEEYSKVWNIIVKNHLTYTDYTRVWNDIYYTNPWEHTIYKYNIITKNNILVFWEKNKYWYDNNWKGLFNNPTGLVYDWNNKIYVADSWNNIIRVINISDLTISKLLWNELKNWYNEWETDINGTNNVYALFDFPTSIDYENNNLYITDTYNNRIRKVDLNINYTYTLTWMDYRWFNYDNWLAKDVYINNPLWIIKVQNWIIFWDILNWKIRYYNELDKTLNTIVGKESVNENININSKEFKKNYYLSYILPYSNGFYFNDFMEWIIYDYNYWSNWIIWDNDDLIDNYLWNIDENLLVNWDIENDINFISDNNDLYVQDNDIFNKTKGNMIYPISWEYFLLINTKWKYASWSIIFTNNLLDWEKIQIKDKVYEFDDWLLEYNLSNVVVPIWNNLNETLINFTDTLNNFDINNNYYWNIINIFSNDIWFVWNNIILSWSSLNYTLNNINNRLFWWIDYLNWYFSFWFTKDLILWEKYKLSFYIWADEKITSVPLSPLLSIKTWTWNIEEKILNIDNYWSRKEFLFYGIWENQKIEFNIKNSELVFIDDIIIEPISDLKIFDLNDKNNIRIWLLSSFYFIDEDNIIFNDILNKELFLYWSWNIEVINNNLLLFDINSFNLNLKNDYFSNSNTDKLIYTINNNNILYYIWLWNNNFKFSSNIKNEKY